MQFKHLESADIKKGKYKITSKKTHDTVDFISGFLKKHPVGTEFTTTNGEVFVIDTEQYIKDKFSNSVLPIINLRRIKL